MTERPDPYRAAPQVMTAVRDLDRALGALSLEPRLRHLVMIRASQINGCAFCLDLHSRQALRDGEDDRRLRLLTAWPECDLFTGREKAALVWTDALTRLSEGAPLSSATARLDAEFTAAEQAELTLVIGAINLMNRFGTGFRYPLTATP